MANKDSLKRIVKIMDYIEDDPEWVKDSEIIKKFGKDGHRLFSRYCLGNPDAYANQSFEKVNLTQEGVRRLHELRGILLAERRALLMTAATTAIAVVAILQVAAFVMTFFV